MLFILIFIASFAGIGALTQVVIPLMRGRPVFPSLRRESLKQLMAAKLDLKDAENALAEAELRKQAARTRVDAAKLNAEAANLDMTAYEIRENLLDGRLDGDRQLSAGNGETPVEANGTQPNGKDTAH